MKKLLAVAALLLASSAAQAQYTFEYGGKTIRVDPDRGTVQIPGVYDNTKKAKKSKSDDAPAARPAPAVASNSPIGVWLTEEKEGKVRIEQCGANLCGYSVDKRTNQNGEQVLINMKPGKDKWSGRILDPNTGSTYDSTIAMKGSSSLRVQGCAMGGMFCGGQTW